MFDSSTAEDALVADLRTRFRAPYPSPTTDLA